MLRNEDRVPAHRRLPPVILGRSGGNPVENEAAAVLQHGRQPFFRQIRSVFRPQPSPAAEAAPRQRSEQFIQVAQSRPQSMSSL